MPQLSQSFTSSPFFKVLIIYLICINIAGLVSMGLDKHYARAGKWRIKEATLFLIAAIGGGLGSFLGMQLFRHKTKHWYFVIGIPALFIINCICVYFICCLL